MHIVLLPYLFVLSKCSWFLWERRRGAFNKFPCLENEIYSEKKQENCIYFCKKFTTVFCNIWLVWRVFLACTIWILYNYNTMICGDIWELFAIELYFIGEISTISNEFKLFCCQTEKQQYWPSFLGIESKAFNSNFPFKHIPFENVQRNLFSQKKPLVLIFS